MIGFMKLLVSASLADRLRAFMLVVACFAYSTFLLYSTQGGRFFDTAPAAIFLPLILFTARCLEIRRSQAWLFGYLVTAKLAILYYIGPHLSLVINHYHFTNTILFWFFIGLSLVVLWTIVEGRKLTIERMFSLTALAMACWIANQWLGPFNVIDGPRDAVFWEPEVRLELLAQADHFVGEILDFLIFGFYVWVVISLFTFLVVKKDGTEGLMFTRFGHRAIFHGAGFGWRAIFLGTFAACILVGLFSADNTYIATGVMPHDYMPIDVTPWLNFNLTTQTACGQSYELYCQNRLLYHLLQFDFAALKSALMGILKSTPFIALGVGLSWVASRFKFTGLLPILAIGALCGFGWHLAYPNYGYWTPFLSTLQSAVLIGMIAAAAFGAVAEIAESPTVLPDDTIKDADGSLPQSP